MKKVIVLEAVKPLEGIEKSQKAQQFPTPAGAIQGATLPSWREMAATAKNSIVKHSLSLAAGACVTALISVALSENLIFTVSGFASLIFCWIYNEKGGKA